MLLVQPLLIRREQEPGLIGRAKQTEGIDMKRSWWSLKIEGYPEYEPNDADLEHIAKCIKEGYDSGELVQEEDEEEN